MLQAIRKAVENNRGSAPVKGTVSSWKRKEEEIA
jgi:hypothetical protein